MVTASSQALALGSTSVPRRPLSSRRPVAASQLEAASTQALAMATSLRLPVAPAVARRRSAPSAQVHHRRRSSSQPRLWTRTPSFPRSRRRRPPRVMPQPPSKPHRKAAGRRPRRGTSVPRRPPPGLVWTAVSYASCASETLLTPSAARTRSLHSQLAATGCFTWVARQTCSVTLPRSCAHTVACRLEICGSRSGFRTCAQSTRWMPRDTPP